MSEQSEALHVAVQNLAVKDATIAAKDAELAAQARRIAELEGVITDLLDALGSGVVYKINEAKDAAYELTHDCN